MRREFFTCFFAALIMLGCSTPKSVPDEAAAIPVKVARARQFDAPSVVAVSGSVVSPENPSHLSFLVAGKVSFVGPREGDYVRSGQKLASLEATDYMLAVEAATAQAKAAHATLEKAESPARPEVLEQARINFERTEGEFQRMKQLYEARSLPPNDFEKFKAAYEASRQQYEQAKAGGQKEDRDQARAVYEQALAGERVAKKRLADATLYSPIDGYVASRSIEVGDMASPGRPAFELVKLDPVEVSVGVPETDIHLVRVGQKASIRLPAIPDRIFTGAVRVINVAADPSTRSYMVRIAVANPDKVLRLGMIAEVSIESDLTETVVSLPGDAIVKDASGATIVYVYFPDQKRVYARRVEVGSMYGTEIRINNGVSAADQIVIAGQNKLREGSLVDAKPVMPPTANSTMGGAAE